MWDKQFEVKVLGIDMDNKRIDLGIKQLKENPWLSVRSKYEIGSEVKGSVIVRVRNGYIVEIEKVWRHISHWKSLAGLKNQIQY